MPQKKTRKRARPMPRKRATTKRFQQSAHAAQWGLRHIFREELSFRIHTYVSVAALFLMFYLNIPEYQKIFVVLAIMIVMGLEVMNSAIEHLIDFFKRSRDPKIKKIKDTAAAAVLVASIGAGILGLLVFIPPILRLFD